MAHHCDQHNILIQGKSVSPINIDLNGYGQPSLSAQTAKRMEFVAPTIKLKESCSDCKTDGVCGAHYQTQGVHYQTRGV